MPKKNQQLTVPEESGKQRLDIFLSEAMHISRSQAQKLIDDELVLVNDKPPKKAGDAVKTGDSISVISNEAKRNETEDTPRRKTTSKRLAGSGEDSNESASLAVARSEVNRLAKSNSDRDSSPVGLGMTAVEPAIVTETDDYVVINKPSGLLVHPTQAAEKNTLVAWLVKKYPKIKKVGDDPTVRPGIVHRLDKEASGLLVVAKTQAMFDHLKNQFKNRTVEKEYITLVHGKVAKDWEILTFPIARSESNDRMAARPLRTVIPTSQEESLSQSPTDRDLLLGGSTISSAAKPPRDDSGDNDDISPAKDAKTEFFVEKRFANCTLLRIILHTGRMHQIRVHMLAYNSPLVGDPLYFQKKRKKNLDEKLGRLFLHSVKLSFTDLDGNKQTFESSLPEKLQNFLDHLK